MARTWSPHDLDVIPRLGWIREAAPVVPMPRLAAELGLDYLGIKRDDLCESHHGSTKLRKLDYLLASPPLADAGAWAAVGGIGSGNVAALVDAAKRLGRHVHAHLFWTDLSRGVVDNLAFTAAGPSTIHFYASRVAMALRRPSLFLADGVDGVPLVPIGATSALGMVGVARGALELCEQVRAGELPEPARVYVPLGSGGTVAGLAVGLALGGARTTVVAVAVVERLLSTRHRIRALQAELAAFLARAGIELGRPPAEVELRFGAQHAERRPGDPSIVIDHAHLGRRYGATTPASLAACEVLAGDGITLEPVYTGKAMAALMADARCGRLGPVLFWHTARRDPLPVAEGYRERLPPALAERLATPPPAPRFTRRRLVIGAGVAAAGVGVGLRITGYPPLPGFRGAVLALWEAHVVQAAAEALISPGATSEAPGRLPPHSAPSADGAPDAALATVAAGVDRYLTGMPPAMLRDVHAMLALVEHGTPVLARRFPRFTRLSADARASYLSALEEEGGLLAQAAVGLRDLCLVGYYQQPSTWAALGYDGPRVPLSYDPRGPERMAWPAYDALRADAGQGGAAPRRPRSAVR